MDNFIITTLIALLGVVNTFIFSYTSFRQRDKREHRDEGKSSGIILSDIGYIKAGVDDLKRDNRENTLKITRLTEESIKNEGRIARCEERIFACENTIKEIYK